MNEYRCRCGALLPVGGPPQVLPRCPSCREPYGFPTFGTDSPHPPARTSLALSLTISAGALGLAAFLFIAMWKLTRATPRWQVYETGPSESTAREGTGGPPRRTGDVPTSSSGASPRLTLPPVAAPAASPTTSSPPPPETDVVAAFARINRIVVRNNIAGLVAAVFVNSGRLREADDLQELIRKGETDIRREMDKLPPLPPHIEPGDLVFSCESSVLDLAAPLKFAEELRRRLRELQVGMTVSASVRRKGQVVPISITLPEAGPEITELLARVGPPAAVAAPAPPPSPSPNDPRPLPVETLQDIRVRLSLLPKTYLRALPDADAGRLQQLLERAEGNAADTAFLQKNIQGEFLPRVEDEVRQLKLRAAELETKTKGATEGDILVFRDGRKVRGKIEEETPEVIRFRGSLGVVGYARSDVLRIERQTTAGEFNALFQAAQGKPEQLPPLIEWCRARNLTLQKDLVCATILLSDPSRPEARKELGLPAWK